MVFVNGSYDAPTIVATIAQALAATDDFEMHDENAVVHVNNMGYCLKHIPTGHYVTFIVGYAMVGCYHSDYNDSPRYTCGIRVVFSDGWDLETHTFPSTGKVARGFIPFYSTPSTNSPQVHLTPIISPYVFSTSVFIDKYRVVGTIQNTYGGGIGVFFALDFFPRAWVEYDDTEEMTAVLYVKRSVDNWGGCYPYSYNTPNRPAGGSADEGLFYVRPYRFLTQTLAVGGEGSVMEREAFRSEATNKVYFKFQTYENDYVSGRKPYAETRSWFKVSITGGLQIGDILNWIDPDGVTVHKFIVCVCTAGVMYYAIPYENAFDYAVSAKQ